MADKNLIVKKGIEVSETGVFGGGISTLGSLTVSGASTFNGTVSGIDKTDVGLGNVDNTADLTKPISTTTQTALDLKAPLASPSFTGDVAVNGAVYTKKWDIVVPANTRIPVMAIGAGIYGGGTSGILAVSSTNLNAVTRKMYAINLMGHSYTPTHATLLSSTHFSTPAYFDLYQGIVALGHGSDVLYFVNRTSETVTVTFSYMAGLGMPSLFYTDSTIPNFFVAPAGVVEANKITFGSKSMYFRSAQLEETESGNVLVGTSVDDGVSKLNVAGGIQTPILRFGTDQQSQLFIDTVDGFFKYSGVGGAQHFKIRGTTGTVLIGRGITDDQRSKLQVDGNIFANGTIATKTYLVSELPTSSVVGARAYVTNALNPAFLSPVVGGGTVKTPVSFDGTTWLVG